MKILVVYGSKRGGTRGLAEMIGSELTRRGFDVDVRNAGRVADVEPYDAVLAGGALYASRWHRQTRRFVRRQRRALERRPVWLFSSGPLDDSAAARDIPPVRHVRRAIEQVGARGHVTFGGRLETDARGFPAAAMAKSNAGDWRDPDHVARWVGQITSELEASQTEASQTTAPT
jgi:menaquinone-dependent protoporphyrinogen oxidase